MTGTPQLCQLSPLALAPQVTLCPITWQFHSTCFLEFQGSRALPIDINLNEQSFHDFFHAKDFVHVVITFFACREFYCFQKVSYSLYI